MGRTPAGSIPKADPITPLRGALGAVLRQRFDEGRAIGSRGEFGRALRAATAKDAAESAQILAAPPVPRDSVIAARLLSGQGGMPDAHLDLIAEFVGLTPNGLLRRMAVEYQRYR